MTDSVDRPVTRLGYASRTDRRTDQPTDKDSGDDSMNPSLNASPAGGLEEIDEERPERADVAHSHNDIPHVYVFCWPELGIVKVGITEQASNRWARWWASGGEIVYIGETCCMEHARRIEGILLKVLSRHGAPAFRNGADARMMLGNKGGGWTECYRLVQSPRKGEPPESEYDYERAYGLILPKDFGFEFHNCQLHPVAIPADYLTAAATS